MKRWLVVVALVTALVLSGVSAAAAKSKASESKGKTQSSGPIYPDGIFFMD
ncbi:MAG TPA: hypothetical protein GXX29_06450 [Firmicutes bacterium]|nr:hypothetical protein [Bacillota bacterium]